jgi:hypothetical protein
MSLFDLVFIFLFPCTAGLLIRIGWLAVSRRVRPALRLLRRLGVSLGCYLAIVVIVGYLSPPRALAAGGILRYDDWCLAVEKSAALPQVGDLRAGPDRRFVAVTLRVISDARRVRQAAPKGSLVYLLDGTGARYDVSTEAQSAFEKMSGEQPSLTQKLDPQTSLLTVRVFDVPANASELALHHRHGNRFPFPGMFIIGDGFRKRTGIPLALP